ncbi:MAG: FeoB-associated Cys-rich membrane protein [Clostridia bacterium]|nr:FeoB-associated Cys-rich membrane protein [Clostridia bacterium]
MRDWLLANWGNILIIGVLALAVGAVVVAHICAKKKGKSTCAHGCTGCAMQGLCHEKKSN